MSMPDLDLGLTEADLLVQSNPEAMLDVLTIRSLRTRYVDNDVTSVASEPLISLDRDLDTFVRDFQIDDSISDIFLMEDEPKNVKTKQTTTLGSAKSNSKGSKKSNRRTQSVDNIIEATESGSTSSKKPKTFSSLFSRKSKPKTDTRKAKAVTWHTQISDVPSPTLPKPRAVNSFCGKIDDADGGYMTMNKATTHSAGSKPHKTIKDARKASIEDRQNSPDIDGEYAILHTACTDNAKFDSLVVHIDNGNTCDLIHDLSTLPSDVVGNLCDIRGNNILHKCVLKNKASLISTIISIHPRLVSHVNKEEITPVELAIKLGRTSCVKTFMDKSLPPDTGACVSHLSELLTFAMHCRQDKTAGVILDHLAVLSSGSFVSLPTRGKRGPASHVAAERDDINCLQRLVEMGFDVTTAKSSKDRPVDVAHSMGCQASFRYLLLLHVLETVLKETLALSQKKKCAFISEGELRKERNALSDKVTVLEAANQQYQTLINQHSSSLRQCTDIVENMLENKENIQQDGSLKQLRHLLSSMEHDISASDILSRHIKDLHNMLRSRPPQIPVAYAAEGNKASTTTRKLLKAVHSSWTLPDFNIDQLVESTLSAETKVSLVGNKRKTRSKHVKSAAGSDTDIALISGRSSKEKDERTHGKRSNVNLGQVPCESIESIQSRNETHSQPRKKTIDKLTRQGILKGKGNSSLETKPVVSLPSKNLGHNAHSSLQERVSHEYAVIDKNSIERSNSAVKDLLENQNNPELCTNLDIKKPPLTHTKSPDYATISSDIGENQSLERVHSDHLENGYDYSDEDTMSTISSHNSTLQSAVGHLSHGCLSDSDDSCTDTAEPRGRRRNVNEHIIGQFDVSDFSGDNSSDWWSASKCTSCFSQMTNSQMTSYYSEDEYENECYNYVRLNLENEDLPDELLRNHRLCRHLEAVQRLNTENNDVVETVVTASGERIGSSPPDEGSRYINVSDSSDTCQSEQSAHRVPTRDKKKPRVKLFNHCELVSKRKISQSEFFECYDRSADVVHTNRCHNDLDLPWDQLQFSDVEEDSSKDKPWYDVSEDEESLTHAWSSDSEASTLCDSSQED